MTKRAKRLQRLRQSPHNVSFEDLQIVLEDYGFILERSSGSHHSFKLQIGSEYMLFVVPYSRPVKIVYVKEAVRIIDEIRSLSEEEENNSDE